NDEGAPSRVNDYTVLAMLGEGSFSKVYHCQNSRGDEYALKILKKSFLKRKREYKKVAGKMVFCNALDKVQREVAIMKKLSHANLVKLCEIIDSTADDKMFLVLELVQGGQVMNWDDKAFRYRAPNTLSGVLDKEHARRCIRDNILLANSSVYKLADFGVAQMLDDENKLTLRTLPFGTKAASLAQVMDSIREDPLAFEPGVDRDCVDLMRLMLEKDPNKRIHIQELKSHPWIVEGTEDVRFSRANSVVVVEVSQQEIEAAFTPVNNFILMTKLKMKMSSRLARVRKSVEIRHALELSDTPTRCAAAATARKLSTSLENPSPAPTYLNRRPSAITAAGALPAIRLDLSLTPVSSPTPSPVASPKNNERDSGGDALDSSPTRRRSTLRRTLSDRRGSTAEEPASPLSDGSTLSLEPVSNSAPSSPQGLSPTTEAVRLVKSRLKEPDLPRTHAAVPFLPSPRLPSRTLAEESADILGTASDDTGYANTEAESHGDVSKSSPAKTVGKCSLPEAQIASDSTLELAPQLSPSKPARVFEKRKSSITAVSDPYDTSSAFSKAITGSDSSETSPPQHHGHLGDVGDADVRWSGPSVQHREDGISVSAGLTDRQRRSLLAHVRSKRRVLLEAQDSLQQLLRRMNSSKFPTKDSGAYVSTNHGPAASATPAAHMRPTTTVPAVSILARASSSNVVEERPKAVGLLRSQKTVVCSIM
ncbi:hypothetical protein PybrP1_009338, partial [[Pythium] brassicae (nom. inval.)]